MQNFSKYQIEPITNSKSPDLSTFKLSPLEQGFGTTLGNAFRRILLSSIPGASVFAIKIPNKTHEHSTIRGVIEDISHIILNIKRLAIKVDQKVVDFEQLEQLGLENWPTLKITKNTKGLVLAEDIICPPGFTIINKDLKICELTEDRQLTIEMYVRYDRGFFSSKENEELVNSLNIITIDSYFSPILKVAFRVIEEKTSRLGVTDCLEMDVATNGTIGASEALALAAQILKAHLDPIIRISDEISTFELTKKEEEDRKISFLSTPIEELELSMRSFNSLKRSGILTVQELIDRSKADVEQIRNLGKKSLKEIMRKLQERGLEFKD